MQKGQNFKNIIKSLGKQANTKEKFTPSYIPPVDSIVPLRAAAVAQLNQEARNVMAKHLGDTTYSLCEKANLFNVPHCRKQAVTYYTSDNCESIYIGTIEAVILISRHDGMEIAFLTRRQDHTESHEFKCFTLKPTPIYDYVDSKDLATHTPCHQVQMGGELGTVIAFAATPTILNKRP